MEEMIREIQIALENHYGVPIRDILSEDKAGKKASFAKMAYILVMKECGIMNGKEMSEHLGISQRMVYYYQQESESIFKAPALAQGYAAFRAEVENITGNVTP